MELLFIISNLSMHSFPYIKYNISSHLNLFVRLVSKCLYKFNLYVKIKTFINK